MFELALPWALLLLPLPIFIWLFLPRVSVSLSAALRVPFYDAMASIVHNKKINFIGQQEISLLLFSWCLLVFAAAGPRWVGEPQPLTREGRNIMLTLDLSGSMQLPDMLLHGQPVSRLAVVKRAAKEFVKARIGDRIGLILFGTRAYLQTPLTYDHQNVLARLDDATVGLAGQTTSIGDALGLAVKRLQAVPAKGRIIILLTDGANNSGMLAPLKAAELAKLDKIKIYTIGLGAESNPWALNTDFFNVNPSADLDEETLQQVAKATGGKYFRATDTKSLQEIYDTINQLEMVNQEQATVQPRVDYYPWPLALALILLSLWLFQRSNRVKFLPERKAKI